MIAAKLLEHLTLHNEPYASLELNLLAVRELMTVDPASAAIYLTVALAIVRTLAEGGDEA